MAKRKVSAREAVADIRSGMSDAVLREKYDLTPEGLRSLFDKLVGTGYLDVAEVLARKRGFVGTVFISQPDLRQREGSSAGTHSAQKPKKDLINAQEAARDIRSGMSDAAIMEKYQLSKRGLHSLFTKLIDHGIITQADLDLRPFAEDHTVDLREQMPTVSQVFRQMGKDKAAANNGRAIGDVVERRSDVTRKIPISNATPSNYEKQPTKEMESVIRAVEAARTPRTTTLIMACLGLLILSAAIWFLAIPWIR